MPTAKHVTVMGYYERRPPHGAGIAWAFLIMGSGWLAMYLLM